MYHIVELIIILILILQGNGVASDAKKFWKYSIGSVAPLLIGKQGCAEYHFLFILLGSFGIIIEFVSLSSILFFLFWYRYFLQRILLSKVEIHMKSYGIGSQGMTTWNMQFKSATILSSSYWLEFWMMKEMMKERNGNFMGKKKKVTLSSFRSPLDHRILVSHSDSELPLVGVWPGMWGKDGISLIVQQFWHFLNLKFVQHEVKIFLILDFQFWWIWLAGALAKHVILDSFMLELYDPFSCREHICSHGPLVGYLNKFDVECFSWANIKTLLIVGMFYYIKISSESS